MDSEIYCACDGSATGNGYSHAKAGYGLVIKLIGSVKNDILIEKNGIVEPYKYKLENYELIPITEKSIRPSNNRGEYLGLINLMLELIKLRENLIIKGNPPITILSDSLLCIKTLTEWLPNRRRKKTENELKNLDLVFIAESLLKQLQSVTTINLQHIRSHKQHPNQILNVEPIYNLKYISWELNDIADKLATSAI